MLSAESAEQSFDWNAHDKIREEIEAQTTRRVLDLLDATEGAARLHELLGHFTDEKDKNAVVSLLYVLQAEGIVSLCVEDTHIAVKQCYNSPNV